MDFQAFYSRQLLLPEIGQAGQKRLQGARCLVVGAGGLGSSALLYLAAVGIGVLGICDGDCLEESNLHRQPIYAAKDVGKLKADLACKRMQELNPLIKVVSHPYRLTDENILYLFSLYDLILDCTDNFRTKFLMNDAAFLAQKPLIRASIYQFEGQLQTYLPERGDACLRCLWNDVPQEGCVGTCQQVGVIGPLPGFFGLLQAMEAIKYFLKLPTLNSHEILFTDLISYSQRRIIFEKKCNCCLCGEAPTIVQAKERESWEIEFSDLHEHPYELVDIRELEETEGDPYPESCKKVPLSCFDIKKLNSQRTYAFFCQRGRRSAQLVKALRAQGIENTFSVIGGIEAFKASIAEKVENFTN